MESTNFLKICRTCLRSDISLLDISNNCKKTKISMMLTECTSIQVSSDDQLPKNMCTICVEQVSKSYEFKINSLKVQETLHKILSDQVIKKSDEEKIEVKIEPTDLLDDESHSSNDRTEVRRIRPSKRRNASNKRKTKRRPVMQFIQLPNGYECNNCGEIEPTLVLLQKHIDVMHKLMKCHLCDQRFVSNSNLLRHQRNCCPKKLTGGSKRNSVAKKTRKAVAKRVSRLKKVQASSEDESSNDSFQANSFEPALESDVNEDTKVESPSYNDEGIVHNSDDSRDSVELKTEIICDDKYKTTEDGYTKIEDKLFECRMCEVKKEEVTQIEDHVNYHLNLRNHKCNDCDKTFVTSRSLSKHIDKAHSSSNDKRCNMCEKSFKSLYLLTKHKQMVHDDKLKSSQSRQTCPICNTTVCNLQMLKRHMKGMHMQKDFNCDLCKMSFHTEQALQGHRRVHGKRSGYHCKFCISSFKVEQELDDHVSVEHASASTFPCPKCGKVFYVEQYLEKHIRNHTAKPKHLCVTCGKTFLLKSNLTTHIRIHSGEKPYVCKTCGAAFSQWAALRFHDAVHDDKRSFECNICGSKWKRKIELTLHMRKHNEDYKHTCPICNKQFDCPKNLRRHKDVHSGEKKHQCETCGKMFMRATQKRVHERIHTGEKPHVCSFCGAGFIQNHCLISHVKRYHKDECSG